MAKTYNSGKKRKSSKQDIDDTLIDVVEVRDKGLDFFEENKKLILTSIILFIALVAGYTFYKYLYKAPREQQAFEQMYRAELQFSRDSFALALENPGGGFDGFLTIIDDYSGTDAANISKYYAGISYLNLGRHEDAIEYLKSYSPAGEITPSMTNGAIGDAYSELNDFDQALSYYNKAANSNNDLLTPYYLNKLGLLKQKMGDNAGALQAFLKIKDKFPKSNEGAGVQKYITMLQ